MQFCRPTNLCLCVCCCVSGRATKSKSPRIGYRIHPLRFTLFFRVVAADVAEDAVLKCADA